MQTTTSEARYPKKTYSFKQLNLFTKKIQSAYLLAWESPRKAFYRIWIETVDGEYSVVKESGIRGKVLDRRTWPVENLEAAQELFQRRIKAKTNPERKSPRKYTLVQNN
jgi:hypothetical protein